MRPVLIDTNAYSAFKKGNSDAINILQLVEEIIISPIVLGELLSGFEGGKKNKQNRLELDSFLDSFRVKIYPVTSDTASYFSKIVQYLKLKGKPIPTNDVWIAAQALEHGCLVYTYDKHFDTIDGLLTIRAPIDLML